MNEEVYRRLAERLDQLAHGFPATEEGVELRLLAWLCSPEEAALAAELRLTLETPAEIAARLGGNPESLRSQLKEMARRGLIKAGRAATGRGLGYGLLPFVVGIYEYQFNTIDAEMAQLFESYYQKAFGRMLTLRPFVHRVIPVQEALTSPLEVRPFESAADIVNNSLSWGVVDCLCRQQQALIGNPCNHPLDVCMVLSPVADAFHPLSGIRLLTREQALATLRRAAEAGLVHSVSNNQEGLWYICNCCACACGVLRGMAELGVANVIARSAFVNQVDEAVCVGCGLCLDRCQFGALQLQDRVQVDPVRCVGCGVCALACPEGALVLVRRPDHEIEIPPLTEAAWQEQRAAARGIDLERVR